MSDSPPSTENSGDRAEDTVWRSIVLANANYAASLLAALTVSLILPLAMAKEEFADVRTFLLFAGYGGLLGLGILDGFYLSVVGTRLSDVSVAFVQTVRRVTSAIQIAAVGLVILVLRLAPPLQQNQRLIVPATLLGALTCYASVYAYLLQGTGRFRLYVRINAAATLAAAVGILGLVVVGRESYAAVSTLYILSTFLAVAIFEFWWKRWASSQRGSGGGHDSQLAATWRRGVILFSANGCLLLTYSMDKLIVATGYSKSDFAEYAFAAGIAGILYLALDALAYAINPFIGGELRVEQVAARRLKTLLVMVLWCAPVSYWLAARGTMAFLPAYSGSLPPLRAFMASVPLVVVFRAWVIPAVRAAGLESRLLMIGAAAVVLIGSALAATSGSDVRPGTLAWVWSSGMGLLASAGLLILGSRSRTLAGPSPWLAMANAGAACVLFFFLSQDLSWGSLLLYLLATGGALAATWLWGTSPPHSRVEQGAGSVHGD